MELLDRTQYVMPPAMTAHGSSGCMAMAGLTHVQVLQPGEQDDSLEVELVRGSVGLDLGARVDGGLRARHSGGAVGGLGGKSEQSSVPRSTSWCFKKLKSSGLTSTRFDR